MLDFFSHTTSQGKSKEILGWLLAYFNLITKEISAVFFL